MFYKQATIASFLSAVWITVRVVIFLRPIRVNIIGVSAIVFFLWTLFRNPQSLPAEASAQRGHIPHSLPAAGRRTHHFEFIFQSPL
jgi:hypothetical protein